VIVVFLDGMAALPAIVWLAYVIARVRRGVRNPAFVRATVEAVVAAFLLAHVNRWFDLWKSHPNFPSGHETVATCMAVALAAIDRRTLPFSAVLLAVLGYWLVRTGWHGRFEVIGGFLLGAAVMLVSLKVNRVPPRTA
jgi:membrane-associated phospholipid phosphatase